MPLDALDVPFVVSEDPFFLTLRERPNTNGRVVAGCGEALVVRRETEATYGLSICGPCSEVDHVGLEILDDSRLVRGRDVGARVVEGQCTDGSVVRLEDRFKIERQPVPSCEFPTRGPSQDAATIWRPLGAMLGWGNNTTEMTDCDGIHGTSNFVGRRVDEFSAERCRGVVWIGLWWQELQGRERLGSARLHVHKWHWMYVRR
jgi:hypothetical protein